MTSEATETTLPAGFAALEPFVATWVLPRSADRARQREASSADALRSFYNDASPLLGTALAYLDAKPGADQDDRDERLMLLCLSLAHVALAAELQKDAESENAMQRHHMRITRSSADNSLQAKR
ncbi:MAG TPA: hypothetical protein VJM09_16175 [Sphingobium sp.]|nr:hypothetical protein [Sphingobium sp.]